MNNIRGNGVLKSFFAYFLFSITGIIGKYNALTYEMFSAGYIMLLFIQVAGLLAFTIIWQILLKKYELSLIYLFKGTTIMWGMLFAHIFFDEVITTTNIVGGAIIVIGIGVVLND